MSVGAVLLAAGGSARLGEPKQLLMIDGETLLRRMARVLVASTARPLVVVLGAQAEACANQVKGMPIEIVVNGQWKQGLASSIRAAMTALDRVGPSLEAVVMAVCDQPLLTPGLIDLLMSKWRATESRIVACEYNGVRGVPALFSARCFAELAALRGDRGAKPIIEKHRNHLASVPFPGGAHDIDTAEDWARFSRLRTGELPVCLRKRRTDFRVALSATRMARETISPALLQPVDETARDPLETGLRTDEGAHQASARHVLAASIQGMEHGGFEVPVKTHREIVTGGEHIIDGT